MEATAADGKWAAKAVKLWNFIAKKAIMPIWNIERIMSQPNSRTVHKLHKNANIKTEQEKEMRDNFIK